MKRFTQAVRLALANGNSYSALLTALALPDICGGLENPKQGSKDRYVGWARQWIEPVYTVQFNVWEGPAFDAWEAERPLRPTFTFPSSYEDYGRYQEDRDRRQAAYEAEYEAWSNRRPKRPSLFLPAEDLYALRCAMLHSGSDNAEEQRAAQTLKRYCFIAPGPYTVHNNSGLDDRGNRVLQLQVDIFCKDIADKVDEWDTTVAGNAAIQSRKERELVWIITPDMTEQWHSRFGLGGSSGLPASDELFIIRGCREPRRALMADDEGYFESHRWLDRIIEGGLPQILAGPAGKAISRLVGEAAEIPAAYLRQIRQSIDDKTEARSIVMKAAAARAAELGIQDVPRMIRGFDNLIGRAFREQVNKDAVAGKTIEDLEAEPSPADSPGPSDDWLNVFEGYAAKATSDGLRDLWARVLAGEIRKPASFSLATLHLISILDGEMAQGIEYILDRALDGSVALIDFPETKQQSLLIGAARSAGVILDSDQNARLERAISAEGIMHYRVGETGIIGVGKPGTRLFFDGIGLTKVGRELWRALQPKGDEQTIESTINLLRSDPGLERITRGRIPKGSGRTILQNPKVVWQRANGATQ